ncbi:hypothetical protein CAS74_004327 [Pichia kudriavzevii]|uniref:Protein TMA23 n=1 Tax=Pichia kudriavzevii TaxID=4909 RepID=A0A1Z8JJQ2_PICKU|nr:hypothetical protein CAS74_004327 [Pichia kudriavzevii]
MDSEKYLISYGWKKGEPLQKGGIKKPILVSHKFDLKGVGHQAKDTITWWETAFDGKLKSLNVNESGGFKSDQRRMEELEREERKKKSPLYQMFVKGETLVGTVDGSGRREVVPNGRKRQMREEVNVESEQLVFFLSDSEDGFDGERRKDSKKRAKKDRKDKEDKKTKKEKTNKEKTNKEKTKRKRRRRKGRKRGRKSTPEIRKTKLTRKRNTVQR